MMSVMNKGQLFHDYYCWARWKGGRGWKAIKKEGKKRGGREGGQEGGVRGRVLGEGFQCPPKEADPIG